MSFGIIVAAIIVVLAIYVISIYNKLVRFRVLVQEAFSGVDVFLKKRHDLIPNLVETVKGYATHERETLEKVIQARNMARSASSIEGKESAEKNLNQALLNLMAVAEQYPDLKADANFQNLQNQLSSLEDDVEKARRYYNGTARNFNIKVQSFPSNIIANMFSFQTASFFELDSESEKAVPNVSF